MQKNSLPQGANAGPSGVHYRLWAPVAQKVTVEVSGPGEPRIVPLLRGPGDFFHALDEQGRVGDLYKFRLDDGPTFPDPASRYQPEGVHGPSMVIDPESFTWHDGGWQRPAFRDLVIYELHVGTFTAEGTFRAAIEKLQHVRDLGATAIEIMPVAAFPGERNWGYDGVCLYAPARAYGKPDDMRALVDAAHQVGLTVILDVVYNHFGPDGNYLACYIGDYLDENEKTPWGGAIRYGDPKFAPLRAMVVANPGYWMTEFHIDGFRLDATHAIVDASPRHILEELTASIHERGGFAIAEDSRNDANLLVPQAEGGFGFDGVWADDFHHTVRVAHTQEHESYFANFTGSLEEIADTLTHGWHYRGQHSKSRGAARGTECGHVPPERFVHCISNHDQVGNHAFGERIEQSISREALRASVALLCLSPYTPMIFMGQEWAASTPFLFFTDHNAELGKLVTIGRREEFKDFELFKNPGTLKDIPDPQAAATFEKSKLKWEECTGDSAMLALYRACLALRQAERTLRPSSRDRWEVQPLSNSLAALRHYHEGGDWLILFALADGHEGTLNQTVCQPPEGSGWSLVLSTEEERFGGSGRAGVDPATMEASFAKCETVVLRQGMSS